MKVMFIVTDLYDLNNSRVMIEYLANKAEVHVYFLTTPLKPYRKIFALHQKKLVQKVGMTDAVTKHVGNNSSLNHFLRDYKFNITFLNSSYYNQFLAIDALKQKANMGKVYGLSWGFDGTDIDNRSAYAFCDKVFSEGPLFFGNGGQLLKMYKHKIHYAHPYYDVFQQCSQKQCREKLGIKTNKPVVLLVETGNIAHVDKKWKPLYLKILESISRENYIVFKARSKEVKNPCKEFMKDVVDLYIENEWFFPPCSAVAAISSDYIVLPCESKYALEAICADRPTVMYSKGRHKGAGSVRLFNLIHPYLHFEDFSIVNTHATPKTLNLNRKSIKQVVSMHEHGNCQYIWELMQNE